MHSTQSEEWGYRGLAKQLSEYALKTNVAWTNAPNPGPHHTLSLSAADTRDAKATYMAEKADYISQLNITQAIIPALNIAVLKQFKHGMNAAGGIMGANPYCNNQDLRGSTHPLWQTISGGKTGKHHCLRSTMESSGPH